MGKVFLVGAGPGDPDLLTVKALRVLERADVVLYDRLISAEILACISPRALLVDVGKEEGEQAAVQSRIVPLLAEYTATHDIVVRLKGGDPMVFGRGGEEILELGAQGIPVEVVPGLSSAIAVPELAGIPLTYRGVARSFAVVTGQLQEGANGNWKAYADIDTLVVMMGVRNRAQIAASLIRAGRPADEPVAFIVRGSTPTEEIVITTLGRAGEADVEAPAIMVVGQVVALQQHWHAGLGRTVAVKHQVERL